MLCLSTPHADCILPVRATEAPTSTLPQHAPRRMHLDVAPVSANASALPQHVLRGLHPVRRLAPAETMPLPQHVLRGLHHVLPQIKSGIENFASARPTRIASAVSDLPRTVEIFASARPTRIASRRTLWQSLGLTLCLSTSYADCIATAIDALPASPLCLSTSYADCIHGARRPAGGEGPLPQHVLRGLHPVCPRGTCATAPFASARPTRIASFDSWIAVIRPLLCLSTSYADCIHVRRT